MIRTVKKVGATMLLRDALGNPYSVHFFYTTNGRSGRHLRHLSIATFHEGVCREPRPCGKGVVAQVPCSRDDAFDRPTGRKLALLAAMGGFVKSATLHWSGGERLGLPKTKRRELWASYFERIKPTVVTATPPLHVS